MIKLSDAPSEASDQRSDIMAPFVGILRRRFRPDYEHLLKGEASLPYEAAQKGKELQEAYEDYSGLK